MPTNKRMVSAVWYQNKLLSLSLSLFDVAFNTWLQIVTLRFLFDSTLLSFRRAIKRAIDNYRTNENIHGVSYAQSE